MSDSVRPHRRQPTRLPRPWDSPGKNTGVGYHFLLQRMKVKSESEVAESCPNSSRPHGLRPTRLLHPWDFPGKSTGVGCCARQIASATWGLQSLLAFFRLAPFSEPYSKWKRASSEGASWAPCGHCTARISCCGCLPNLINCC